MDARRILITGVTRGLGRALFERFAAPGGAHRVVGCGRSENAIVDLRARFASPHDVAAVDVSDAQAVNTWAARVLASHGAPDLLINNAALMNECAPLWEVPAEEFDALLAVNISGTANVVRAFAPAMIENGGGVIVNVSSGWGRSTSPDVGPYCTTKWAIEGYTSALAQDLPSGLAAVALNPGIIDTEMLRTCWGESAAEYEGPESWARRAAPFLLELGAKDNGRSLDAP